MLGAPEDLFQCVQNPSIPLTGALMAEADLTLATGGKPMVRAAYSSGKPALGVGAGSATMVIDETADINDAARNNRISKTSDFGSGFSADGNLVIDDRIYDALRAALVAEGGHLCSPAEKALLEAAMWDADGHRTIAIVVVSAQRIGEVAGFTVPPTLGSSWSSRTKSSANTASRRESCALSWRSTATSASMRR